MSVLEQYVDAGVPPIPAQAPGVVSARNLIKRKDAEKRLAIHGRLSPPPSPPEWCHLADVEDKAAIGYRKTIWGGPTPR